MSEIEFGDHEPATSKQLEDFKKGLKKDLEAHMTRAAAAIAKEGGTPKEIILDGEHYDLTKPLTPEQQTTLAASLDLPKQKMTLAEGLTKSMREALYLEALEKWAKRVQMWHKTNKGRPPVILDKHGNAHWMSRAQRRAK